MNNSKEKVLFITPHLSTGGLPQYLVKKVEVLIDIFDIYVIEYENVTGGQFVVQRNNIQNLLKNDLITLDEDKSKLLNYVNAIEPNYVHIEEFPETFIDKGVLLKLYAANRKYKIFETSHGSNRITKSILPDKFIFVSPYQLDLYKDLNVPMELVEYPIEYHTRPNRTDALIKLGLDPSKKHVLNIGLFTPGKNQSEIFDYARFLPNLQFHFIGNQAGNFIDYWQPLMDTKPDNCVIWGERSDVDSFYSAMDLFLFTSNLELNPLVIREAIGWRIPILMYDLPVYKNTYDKYENINFLNGNFESNLQLIDKDFVPIKNDISKEIVVITAYPDTEQKEKYLNELIDNVTSFGYDIMISSHYNIPEYIKSKVKYCVLDLTDNLLYRKDYSEFGNTNIIYNKNNNRMIKKTTSFNHSYAVYLLWKNAINSIDKNYEKVHILDYDCIINNKKYFDNHSSLLNRYDIVVYKSNDILTDDRYTTNLFSFKINENITKVFNYFNNKKDFFINEFKTSLLEDILYHLIKKNNVRCFAFKEVDLHRYDNKINLVSMDNCDPLDELSTPYYKNNIYNYSDTKDILLLSDMKIPVIVDNNKYEIISEEKLYLIDKLPIHIISYNDNKDKITKVIYMEEHGKFNAIELYNESILIKNNT